MPVAFPLCRVATAPGCTFSLIHSKFRSFRYTTVPGLTSTFFSYSEGRVEFIVFSLSSVTSLDDLHGTFVPAWRCRKGGTEIQLASQDFGFWTTGHDKPPNEEAKWTSAALHSTSSWALLYAWGNLHVAILLTCSLVLEVVASRASMRA